MSGHVYITRGDLTRLSCDAWLLPTSHSLHVTRGWRARLTEEQLATIASLRQRGDGVWNRDGGRVSPLDATVSAKGAPRIVLVDVGGGGTRPPEWYAEGVRQFFHVVAHELRHSDRGPRALPLVALPVVGTGAGGAATIKGEILQVLLALLEQEAQQRSLDIVLVTDSAEMFAAAQSVRKHRTSHRSHADGAAGGWGELSEDLREQANLIARHARRGNLVLFLGSGVSVGAGLPDWAGLLRRLARAAGLDDNERHALRQLHPLDQARLLGTRIENGNEKQRLGHLVAAQLKADRYSLAHSLLAALPVEEFVTTNYDTLFERAAADAGHRVAVLPYKPPTTRRRWLLKLHGCIEHPDDIVLTREDYLRYAESRAALAGIVQALLITRHMLFVGFSLTDDNFHRIVDDVRKAIRPRGQPATPTRTFGAAVVLKQQPLFAELWRPDLDFIAIDQPEAELEPIAAARRLDIFLDLVLAEATDNARHLLDPAFDAILSAEERWLREELIRLRARAPETVKGAEAWRAVAALFSALGDPADDARDH